MGVLARDIEAYRRAVDQYRLQTGAHNAQVSAYNNTVATKDGNPLVARGAAVYTVNADGTLGQQVGAMGDGTYNYDQYGLTPIEGSPEFSMLRKNPTSTNQETVNNVRYQLDDSGTGYYYVANNEGAVQSFSPEWQPVGQPTYDSDGNPVYTLSRNVYTFLDKPADFTGELKAQKPDPTAAQLRKLGAPSLAAQERGGLIGDVIRSGGSSTIGGGRSRAAAKTEIPADPPPTEQPVDNYVYVDPSAGY